MKSVLFCGFLAFSVSLRADLLLNTGVGNSVASRTAGSEVQGSGTPVTVSTTTTLTNMALDLDMPNGGTIEYMIWDGTDTSLLFSETQALAASASLAFVQSADFSFALVGGQTYYFGVISNATTADSLNISYFSAVSTFSQNGLNTICCNSNYYNFASPTPSSGGGVTLALQLFGTQGAVPEPSTFEMTAGAALALAGFWSFRHKLR